MKKCGCFWKTPVIKASGKVFPCALIASQEEARSELCLGDLRKNAFIEIWNGKSSQQFRKWSMNEKLETNVKYCSTCIGSSCVPNNLGDLSQEDIELLNKNINHDFKNRWLTIELSDVCNLKCWMCGINHVHEFSGFLDLDIFSSLIKNIGANDFTVDKLQLHYEGESFMHPKFLDILQLINGKKGFYNSLILDTNAHFMDDKIIEELLKVRGLFLTFSIDASTKKTYNIIRRGGDFELAMNNIRRFLKASKGKNVQVRLQFIIQKLNEHEIADFAQNWAKYLHDLGLEYSICDQISQNNQQLKPYQIFFKFLTGNGQVDGLVSGYEQEGLTEEAAKLYFLRKLNNLTY